MSSRDLYKGMARRGPARQTSGAAAFTRPSTAIRPMGAAEDAANAWVLGHSRLYDWWALYDRAFVITVPAGKVSANVAGFPLYLSGAGFPADFWSTVNADGRDFAFGLENGTALPRDLVSIDTGGQTLQCYTRASLTAATATRLVCYYGRTMDALTAAEVAADRAAMWQDYTTVLHLDEASGTLEDATGDYDGAANGTFAYGQTGQLGSAVSVVTDGYLSSSAPSPTTGFTVSCWVNAAAFVNRAGLIVFTQGGNYSLELGHESSSGNKYRLRLWDAGGSGIDYIFGAVTTGAWQHVAATWDGANVVPYVNGVAGTPVARATALRNLTGLWCGRYTAYLNGLLDEVRVAPTGFSAARMVGTHANMTAPASFVTCGDPFSVVATGYTKLVGESPDTTPYSAPCYRLGENFYLGTGRARLMA